MSLGRPPFGFFLLDFPSDHEIDAHLTTECQAIRAILHNRGLGSRVKSVRASTLDRFGLIKWNPYRDVGFVHLAGHGSRQGISFIGGNVSWNDVGNRLKRVAPKLTGNRQRVLSISTCNSRSGARALRTVLRGHFTGIYHFRNPTIGFATAMTVWSMFYQRKTIDRPAKAVVDRINDFFEDNVLAYIVL